MKERRKPNITSMRDLRLQLRDLAKRRWAQVPPEERARRMSELGKKSWKKRGKKAWDLLTAKQKIELITKMNSARLKKYAKPKSKSN